MTLPVGTVIKFLDYPDGEDGIVKPYWFIIMGRTSQLFDPQYYFLYKTTTQKQYYQANGTRVNNNFKLLTFPFFDCECYVDFDLSVFDKHSITEIDNLIINKKVEVKGRLDSILTELYHLSIKGSGASQKIKELFHTSFNLDGITGLKLPQSHNKEYYRNKFNR